MMPVPPRQPSLFEALSVERAGDEPTGDTAHVDAVGAGNVAAGNASARQLAREATLAALPAQTTQGRLRVRAVQAHSILSRATGFIDAFDYTLNPYRGCAFGCTYCYAAFFARDVQEQQQWGHWVDVKQNAITQLRRMRRSLDGARIYASSVTDPYQPIERRLELFRGLLEELQPRQPRLTIQTRAPLVVRDIDVLQRFAHLRVHMTVTTDDEEVRRAFEPTCAPNAHRLAAVRALHDAGIPTAITMTPLLPVRDPDAFADALLESGAERFVVQEFHATTGRFVAGTGAAARAIAAARHWDLDAYRSVRDLLQQRLPGLLEGREGFVPG